MGLPDHLTCILRNLNAIQTARIRIRQGIVDWLQIVKDCLKPMYCHPAYLNYIQSASCKMPGWVKDKLESRLLGEISITSDLQMTSPFGRKWRGTKEPLDESEREE